MKKNGFTLVELLVVMVIIGLLLALLPIAFDRALPGLEAKSTAREMAAVLRTARSMSIRDNQETSVTVNVTSRRYVLDGTKKSQEIAEGIDVSLFTATTELDEQGGGRIRFFPDGTSTGGRVTLAGASATYYILVDWLSGRVEIVDRVADPQ
jgi:general secretion pathway protein H